MKDFVKKLAFVLAGGTIQGFGMGMFLFPNYIPSGGAGGIAVILNYGLHLDVGLALWIVNFVMLLFGVKVLGKRFALWTVLGMTVTSLSIHFFQNNFVMVERNVVFDLVFGSVFLGTGIGLLMRKGVSNGGVGVIALMIAYGRQILPGKPLFIINCSIFLLTGIVISWQVIILAFISQWISTTVVDYICRMTFHPAYSLGWRKK